MGVSFQSRFGREPWVQPYTDETLIQLAHSGRRQLDIILSAFAADCLETLEEIAVEVVNRAFYRRVESVITIFRP